MKKSTTSYRLKKELISSLDLLKTDAEKFGKNLWQLTLREKTIDEKLIGLYSTEELSLFEKSFFNLLQNPVEIVRRKSRTEHQSVFEDKKWVKETLKRNPGKVKIMKKFADEDFEKFEVINTILKNSKNIY